MSPICKVSASSSLFALDRYICSIFQFHMASLAARQTGFGITDTIEIDCHISLPSYIVQEARCVVLSLSASALSTSSAHRFPAFRCLSSACKSIPNARLAPVGSRRRRTCGKQAVSLSLLDRIMVTRSLCTSLHPFDSVNYDPHSIFPRVNMITVMQPHSVLRDPSFW